MDQSKRNFMKMLPIAALAGAGIKLGTVGAKVVEIQPHKKYIFRVPADTNTKSLEWIRRFLREDRGIDATILTDNVEIFELS